MLESVYMGEITALHKKILLIVEAASQIALGDFCLEVSFDNKVDFFTGRKSIVTDTDIKVNDFLVTELLKLLPGSKFITEEEVGVELPLGKHSRKEFSDFTWIIDPIDGTGNFHKGFDMWGISIALWKGNDPVYGLLYFPRCLDRYFYAIEGDGAYNMYDQKVQLRKKAEYKPAFSIETIYTLLKDKIRIHNFGKPMSYKATGSTVYDAYNLIRGSSDFILIYDLAIWDIAAMLPIVKEIGLEVDMLGDIIDLDEEDIYEYKRRMLIAKPDTFHTILPQIQTILIGF